MVVSSAKYSPTQTLAHILIAESAKVLSGQCEVHIWLIESANIPISVHAVTQLLVIEY